MVNQIGWSLTDMKTILTFYSRAYGTEKGFKLKTIIFKPLSVEKKTPHTILFIQISK